VRGRMMCSLTQISANPNASLDSEAADQGWGGALAGVREVDAEMHVGPFGAGGRRIDCCNAILRGSRT
jgi:hypothetical protein